MSALRVAVAGVGHYHAAYTPVYLDLLKQHGGELVVVSDSDLALAEDRARRFGGRCETYRARAALLPAPSPFRGTLPA